MKHSLQLKLSQHLTLTPQLQQSIRLLQLSTLDLNHEIELFIQENPLLERDGGDPDETPTENPDYFTATPTTAATPETNTQENPEPMSGPEEMSENWAEHGSGNNRDDGDDQDFQRVRAETLSLRDHLMGQLSLTQLSQRDRTIVSLLIDALNDDGYLTLDLNELAELLPEELEIEMIELQTALKHLQNFDPPGIGARNLSECLALQLEAYPKDTPNLELTLTTVRQHLAILGARDYAKLRRLLQCNEDTLRAIQKLITQLNPKPGAAFSPEDTRYILPDVVVRKVKGLWVASLNSDAMPKLRINRMYAEILQRNRDNTNPQLSNQLQEARWLIKNVQQRFDTILRVSQAIVDRQRHFFEHGEVAMRPLVLREIAESVGLHESTVSRVTTQKYMLTPRGIYELKYFFGSHVTTETGGACSATAIRAIIKQLIGAEDQKKPLSDSQIMEILAQQGIVVARRTVAKYRESLHISAVNLRKTI